jgi:HlyD family secretion protein
LYLPIQAITMRERTDSTDVVGKFSKKTWRSKKGATKDENDIMFGPNQGGSDGASRTRGRSESDKMVQVVFVVTDGLASMIPVDTGLSSERNVEILSDLDEDAQIVTGSFRVLTKQLKEGSKVKVKNKKGKPSRNPT